MKLLVTPPVLPATCTVLTRVGTNAAAPAAITGPNRVEKRVGTDRQQWGGFGSS